jgi:oligopeptide/dipeptide ABC transporter ATP-binding protein
MSETTLPTATTPLIEARNLRKFFFLRPSILARALARRPVEVVQAVNQVDLAIWPGETLGLVGESGSGKTTVGRMLTRLYLPTSGDILFQGHPLVRDDVTVTSDRSGNPHDPVQVKFYRLAQIIFQNPYSSLNPRKTVREILATPLRHRGIRDPYESEERIVELIRRVGLSERHIDSYPHQFSGGQRQRIGIARALAMHPRFIVADEPVSSLDVSIQAQVINLLEELQQDFKLTYLFIAHDLSVIYYISTRVAVMYLGHLLETGPTPDLFGNPCHPYTQALLAAIPRVKKELRRDRILLEGDVPSPINPPSGCPFHPRCFAKVGKICEQEMPPFFQVGSQQAACWIYQNKPLAENRTGEAAAEVIPPA